ncbi:hypothetical protein Tco_1185372 [Tanacetum coccineum]
MGKPPLQPIRNQPVVRQPTAYKSERFQVAKHRLASQVDVSNNLTKPVTPHSWPPARKLSFAKPYDVNAPSPSRKSPKHVSFQSPKESVGSIDIVHNYYLEEAKNKAQLQQNKALNIKPSNLASSSEVPSVLEFLQQRKLEAKKALKLSDKSKLKIDYEGISWLMDAKRLMANYEVNVLLIKLPPHHDFSLMDILPGKSTSSHGRALALHARGTGFDSLHFHIIKFMWPLREQ